MDAGGVAPKRSRRKRKEAELFVPESFKRKKPSGKRKKKKARPKIHGNVKNERDIRKKAAERAKPAVEYANRMHK